MTLLESWNSKLWRHTGYAAMILIDTFSVVNYVFNRVYSTGHFIFLSIESSIYDCSKVFIEDNIFFRHHLWSEKIR
jgi:hypothetical protein